MCVARLILKQLRHKYSMATVRASGLVTWRKSQPGLPNSIVAIFCPAVKSETEMGVNVFALEANMPEAYRD